MVPVHHRLRCAQIGGPPRGQGQPPGGRPEGGPPWTTLTGPGEPPSSSTRRHPSPKRAPLLTSNNIGVGLVCQYVLFLSAAGCACIPCQIGVCYCTAPWLAVLPTLPYGCSWRARRQNGRMTMKRLWSFLRRGRRATERREEHATMSDPTSGDDLPGAHDRPPVLASDGVTSTTAPGSGLPSGQGGSAREPRGVREHPREFELVQQQRARFDASAWRAAIAGRARMPRLTAPTFDPGPDVLAKAPGQLALFLADDGAEAAEVRPVTTAEPILGGVATVEVAGRSSFLPGTLVVRISPDSTRDVDPRTLQLVRWDAALRRAVLLRGAGTNLQGGSAFARITHRGRCAVVGLPKPAALNRAEGGLGSTEAFDLIITRLFAPEGPWSSLGPHHLSCCILDLAIDPANNDQLYCAASDGGVWRLDSLAAYPGATWVPLTDQQPSLEINCLAVSPADSRVVYYVDRLGNLYRSATRGDSWALTSSTNLGNAQRLLAHPSDPNTIYVASDAGLWRSYTGGASWDANLGNATWRDGDMTDAALDPGNPDIIYLAQRLVGLLKSSNGGGAWHVMLPWSSATAPSGSMIKVAVGGQGTDASRTVAVKFDQQVFVNHFGGRGPAVLGGGPWAAIGSNGGNGYGDWCHVLAIDPFNDNVILAGAQQVYRTPDGGQSWTKVIDYYAPHEDQHRLLFDPTQTNVVYAANDGGVFRSSDDGVTWQTSGDDLHAQRDLTLGLVTAQFYTCSVSGDHAAGNAYHQGNLSAQSLAAADWIGGGHAWEFRDIFGDPVRAGRYFIFADTLYQYLFPGTGTAADLVSISTFQPTAIAVDQRPGSAVVLAGTADGQGMRAPDGDTTKPTWTATAGMALPQDDGIVWMDFAPSPPPPGYGLSSAGGGVASA